MAKTSELLNRSEHCSLLAPAGYGKTEEIVRAVSVSENKQLILTHTNAGVASLKSRLRKYKIPNSKFTVDTIASWLLKYSAAYPKISGLVEIHPEQEQWEQVYEASKSLFRSRFIREVIQSSYSGIFIDEYQDCTRKQHDLVLSLADMLPVKILGDPLQGIFGFRKDDPLISWENDVLPIFKPLPELQEPWRWNNANKDLGIWLKKLRKSLLVNEEIDLSRVPAITWIEWSVENEIAISYDTIKKNGSIVGIHMWPRDAHASAKRLGGIYQSMEEMECKLLMETAEIFGKLEGIPLAFSVINFIFQCSIPNDFFREVITILREERVDELISIDNKEIGLAFFRLIKIKDIKAISSIIAELLHDNSIKIFRRELLIEMKRATIALSDEGFQNLHDAAWAVRYRTRIKGRKPDKKIISRTLLIKGLEFDNAILLDASKLANKMHFYVAATRGSHSLTILSKNPIVHFDS